MLKRPGVRVNKPDVLLNIHIAETKCTLSLDSSGESLHRRGYRQEAVEAPLNEVLAAGMILMTGWRGECDLIDPMCGSGTIPIEAALIARNIAPGVFRKEFAFEKWVDFDQELFDTIYNDDSQEREFTHKIYGYDNSPKANEIATHNIKAAGVSKDVVLKLQPFQQFEQPAEKSIIITNPPYGERISTNDLLGLYLGGSLDDLSVCGYTSLLQSPDVAAAISPAAEIIGSTTIYLMRNTDNGDVRVKNALSRFLDVTPYALGTRKTLMEWIVTTMLAYGNAYVLPVTQGGHSGHIFIDLLAGILHGSRHAADAGQVLGAGPLAPLLRAALDDVHQREAPADVQRAHAFGAVELVAGQAEHIDVLLLDVDVQMADGLNGVGVEGHARFFTDGTDVGDG